jgi:hypothetical protein
MNSKEIPNSAKKLIDVVAADYATKKISVNQYKVRMNEIYSGYALKFNSSNGFYRYAELVINRIQTKQEEKSN